MNIKAGRRLPHTLEVTTITLLATHHDPHTTPKGDVVWLNHPWNFIHEGDGASDVVENLAITDLLDGVEMKQNLGKRKE